MAAPAKFDLEIEGEPQGAGVFDLELEPEGTPAIDISPVLNRILDTKPKGSINDVFDQAFSAPGKMEAAGRAALQGVTRNRSDEAYGIMKAVQAAPASLLDLLMSAGGRDIRSGGDFVAQRASAARSVDSAARTYTDPRDAS